MREKLIDLLQSSPTDIMGNHGVGALADHLIANGVTFATDNNVGDKMTPTDKDTNVPSKWIPVTERLPEDGETVLVYGSKGGIYTAWCNRRYQNVGWHKLNSKSHYCNPTHWMPLPEPPKGE